MGKYIGFGVNSQHRPCTYTLCIQSMFLNLSFPISLSIRLETIIVFASKGCCKGCIISLEC